jgi:hypothetical protein
VELKPRGYKYRVKLKGIGGNMGLNDFTPDNQNLIIGLRAMRNELRQNPLTLILQSITHDYLAMLISPEVFHAQLILLGYSTDDIREFVNGMFAYIELEKGSKERIQKHGSK